MRRARTRGLAVAVVYLIIMGVTDLARAGEPSPSLSPARSAAPDVDQQLDSFSLEFRAAVEASSVFTGMSVNHAARSIDLYVTNATDASIRRAIATAHFPVVVHGTLESERTLLARTASISAVIDALRAKGVDVIRYGPDFTTGRVEVVVLGLTTKSAVAIRQAVGSEVILTNESNAEVRATPSGRSDDYSPWYGADFVTDNSRDGTCTTGFSVHATNGYDYNMTAGHCFPIGNIAQVGAANTLSGEPYGTHTPMGTITGGSYGSSTNGYLDVEFIKLVSGSNSPYVWASNSTTHPVRSTVRVSPGNTVCADGAYDGERCGRVDSTGYLQCQIYSDGKKACSTIQASSTDGLPLIGDGDSGGPVYTSTAYPPPTNAYISAAGMIDAGSIGVACVVYTPRRTCNKVLTFTDISAILTQYSSSVKHV